MVFQMWWHPELFATGATLVRLLSRMQPQVNVPTAWMAEQLSTHMALVVFLVTMYIPAVLAQHCQTHVLSVAAFTLVHPKSLGRGSTGLLGGVIQSRNSTRLRIWDNKNFNFSLNKIRSMSLLGILTYLIIILTSSMKKCTWNCTLRNKN